jgi:hypothetical protein
MTTNNNNKMKTYYIGTRAKWNDIGDVLGRDDVARLNQGLSKSIRTSVMKSGIKKTEQGARLEFYSVSNDEFDKLMKEQDTRVRPLVRVDEELLNKTLTDVNNKYGGRGGSMDYDTHRKYKIKLAEGFDKCVEIIGDDLNTRKKPDKLNGKNPYKVGDWISVSGRYGHFEGNARISRITDKSYWYEFCVPKEGKPFNNWDYAKTNYNNVEGGGEAIYHQEWDFTIPYEGNEDKLTFEPEGDSHRITNRIIESPSLLEKRYEANKNNEYANGQFNNTLKYVAGYRSERYQWD